MNEEVKDRVAANVRRLAEERFPDGPKAAVRRAMGYTNRPPGDVRWSGEVPYDVSQLAVVADLLGVRVADLFQPPD